MEAATSPPLPLSPLSPSTAKGKTESGRPRAREIESAVAAVQANTHRPGVQGICGCMGAWVHGCAVHLVLVRPQRRQGHSSDIPHPRRAANLNTSQRPTRAGHELSTCTVAILRDDSPRAQCKAVWPRKAILKSCAESRRGSIFIHMSGARYDGGGVVRGGVYLLTLNWQKRSKRKGCNT